MWANMLPSSIDRFQLDFAPNSIRNRCKRYVVPLPPSLSLSLLHPRLFMQLNVNNRNWTNKKEKCSRDQVRCSSSIINNTQKQSNRKNHILHIFIEHWENPKLTFIYFWRHEHIIFLAIQSRQFLSILSLYFYVGLRKVA